VREEASTPGQDVVVVVNLGGGFPGVGPQDASGVLDESAVEGDGGGEEQGVQRGAVEAFADVGADGADERRSRGAGLEAGEGSGAGFGTHPAAQDHRVVSAVVKGVGEPVEVGGPLSEDEAVPPLFERGWLAMLARAGMHARTTADADTTWRTDATQLRATLDQAARTDLGDHFHFLIGSPAGLGGEGPEGGLRFPIQSRLAGRVFEPIRLDINLPPDDPRPVETLHLSNTLAVAVMPTVIVPAISAAKQLAE